VVLPDPDVVAEIEGTDGLLPVIVTQSRAYAWLASKSMLKNSAVFLIMGVYFLNALCVRTPLFNRCSVLNYPVGQVCLMTGLQYCNDMNNNRIALII